MIKPGNIFFDFAKDYFYFLDKLTFDFHTDKNKTIVTKKKGHFKNRQIEKFYKIPLSDELKHICISYYNKVSKVQLLNPYYSVDEWLPMVKNFIIFLDKCELASLYKNDKAESVSVVVDEPNSTYILYYYDEENETEYRISFMTTELPTQIGENTIMTYINGTDDDTDKFITLVQIDILRRYGEKRTNQIKLVEKSNHNKSLLANNDEAIIFNIFKVMTSRVIYNTYHDILGNIAKIHGFDRNILEEVLDGRIKLSD